MNYDREEIKLSKSRMREVKCNVMELQWYIILFFKELRCLIKCGEK